MIAKAQLLDFFVEVADHLVADFDVVDFLHNLTVNAAAASGAAAVGLVLTDHEDRVRYMAANNEEGELLELFQIQNDDGPCRDAIKTGQPVVNADLGDAADRWPLFAPAARAAGFQSVHAFPMKSRDHTVGALNIFGLEDTRFDDDEVRLVQAMADLATVAIIHERTSHEPEVIIEQMQAALNNRIVIEQAKGALARAESLTPSQAYELIRSTARSTGQKLSDVARAAIVNLEPRPETG